jgi:purine nucleoside phosphorylase
MSVVHETITAHHCDIKVLAFSLITNICVTERKNARKNKNNNNNNINNNDPTKNVDLETEVLDAANSRKEDLRKFMTKIVANINDISDTKLNQNGYV